MSDKIEKKQETSNKPVRRGTGRPENLPPEELNARDQARLERQKRRKKELRALRIKVGAIAAVLALILIGGGYYLLKEKGVIVPGSSNKSQNQGTVTAENTGKENAADQTVVQMNDEDAAENTAAEDGADTAPQVPEEPAAGEDENTASDDAGQEEPENTQIENTDSAEDGDSVLAQADLMAKQYDYDRAVALLKAQEDYDGNTEYQSHVADYEAAKAACVAVDPTTVVHVFVHCLIVDPVRAFDGDAGERGYNLNMVTIDEFKKIIQSMYDKGYVLISLHDMGYIDESGNMVPTNIYLPEGKKPLVFSQDDISYYHTYTNDGFADKLVVDSNGEVKNQYTDADGNVSIGDYDMVPVLDTFIKEHPDFSYHGRKGIICLTGYNGILGYRTDGDYRDRLHLMHDQEVWLEEHPDFDFDTEVAEATKVAEAMKADGWEFASHTWGHVAVADISLENLQADTQKWHDYVESIVGDTDMIIFAFGSDIGDWTGYASDNQKYQYLKSMGFDYFCNVDGSTLSWVQFGQKYLRTGRMNIDGYRMATNPGILEPLFTVDEVYDYENRPSMSEWTQNG